MRPLGSQHCSSRGHSTGSADCREGDHREDEPLARKPRLENQGQELGDDACRAYPGSYLETLSRLLKAAKAASFLYVLMGCEYIVINW